jgi:2-C-methyl-D-erythritol 4-phosphate cytidylyltransferase/2-C-methyl-D-erythritol 2,4-cyclodiphosphate synthase
MSRLGLVLLAAGSGTRLGKGIPKALVEVNGTTLLEQSLGVVAELEPAAVVVAAPANRIEDVHAIVNSAQVDATVVAGGDTRTASVRAALAALADVDVVLIHDVARAWMPADVFRRVAALVDATGDGVVPVLPVVDTVLVVRDGVVAESTNREELARVQTPQGFPADAYRVALAAVAGDFTDDANLWRSGGGTVRTVVGDDLGAKLTTPADLTAAQGGIRVGLGTDTHAFGGDASLWLGCVEWPGEIGLDGHSDGDAVAHAITDALLQGAGLGDIGSRFGTSDPHYAGARGEVFIRGALEALAVEGFEPRSVSVQIVGNKPKIGPRRVELERVLAEIVGVPVSVSATTTDGLGFTGEGRGITAIAIAHVSSR